MFNILSKCDIIAPVPPAAAAGSIPFRTGSLSFDSVVCYKTLSSGTTVPGGARKPEGSAAMDRASRMEARGEIGFSVRAVALLATRRLARLEGFEPTTPGSEVCQDTCWDVF